MDAGYCPVCNASISADMTKCTVKHNDKNFINFIRPLAKFDSQHKQLIHLFKYNGIVDIGKFFGAKIGEIIARERHFKHYDIFIPVPLHKKRHRERRYNQAKVLADSASKICGKPVAENIIKRIVHTQSQTKLSPSQRRKNVAGAFEVVNRDKITGKNVIIIDDVVTTGATTEEIARILKLSGAKNICTVCIAHPESKDSKKFGI
ncbi:ComF family protein [bacterium]|nr:ComF family protein [bacterium]